MDTPVREVTVLLVIGAGQAGLSAGYHLRRRGFIGVAASDASSTSPGRTFAMLDANPAPGGAWQHRWPSLTMAKVNGIFDLPGTAQDPSDPHEASRIAVPRYFAGYEQEHDLPIHRPVRVRSVRAADADPAGRLVVETDQGSWIAEALINATGTWENPVLPRYPGIESFRGQLLHARDYHRAEDFAGQRIAVVGGGITALQLLQELMKVTTTFWYTRRPPDFSEEPFTRETGREVIARVTADSEAGKPGRSVVSYTGLPLSPAVRAARDRGELSRRAMFTAFEADAVREADGTRTPLDAVLWATGFRPSIAHLEPLDLRGPLGGIPVTGTRADRDPRIHLIGFGASQSTVGANRAGRAAVSEIIEALGTRSDAGPRADTLAR